MSAIFFCKLRRFFGEMQEWLNWHAWKACVLQKGTGGSNPPLSAAHITPVPKKSERVFYFLAWQA